jgi:DNA replication protein DnaC
MERPIPDRDRNDRHCAKIAGVDLLIIDDFGLKPFEDAQDEHFHDIILESTRKKSRGKV